MRKLFHKDLFNPVFVVVLVLLGGVSWLTEYWSLHEEVPGAEAPVVPQANTPVSAVESMPAVTRTLHPAAAEFAQKLEMRTDSAEEDLLTVQQLLLAYQRATGENPEGDNEDVVEALLGNNKHHLAFLPEKISRIRDGRLLDRWGTPYFMHPESASHMSLRSAGPDTHLFTDDDVVLE